MSGVTDEQAEKAVDFIRDNARAIAEAKATVLYLSEFRKSIKAQLMRDSNCDRVADQETAAYAHPSYLEHLKALRIAEEQAEQLRWMMIAAQAKLELYRSQEASRRAERG